MRLWISVLTVVVGLLVTCSLSEAKPGKGRGGGRGRGKAAVVLGSPVERGNAAFSSSFPRGNAWGLRRRLGISNPRAGSRSRLDGDRIFRGGREWEWDARSDSWLLVP